MDDLVSLPLPQTGNHRADTPWWVVRGGRGRIGGSTFLDYLVQRSRHRGRRVKPLDADLRSRTLTDLYPTQGPQGARIEDGASSPATEDLPIIKAWFEFELDASVGDRVSRVVDFGGGDRVLQEYGRELKIGEFCREFGLGLVFAFVLGPDPEDLRHVTQVINSGATSGGSILLVLNEGVIRTGQSVEGVFDQTVSDPGLRRLLDGGADMITMPRLTCLDALRAQRLGFYEAAAGGLDREGKRVRPTVQHMTSIWLRDMDGVLAQSEASQWLA